MKQFWNRWGPLTGLLSVACSFVGVMVSLGQPQARDSDAQIVAYFASHPHRVQVAAGFFVVLAGTLLLLAFLVSLRERLLAADGPAGGLSALVFGAGVASVPLWLISMLLGDAAGFVAGQTSRFRLDPNTFRIFVSTAYVAWVAAVVVSALVVWGTSAVAFRTGLLPRWFAGLGILAGTIQLFAFLFVPVFVWWLWLAATSVLLVRRHGPATVPVVQPAR